MNQGLRLSLVASLALANFCAGAQAQAGIDAEVATLLAAQKPEDVAALRDALPGRMSAAATFLLMHSNAAGARRSALIEKTSPVYPVVTLLVDRGTEAWLYEWTTPQGGERRHDGHWNVREMTPAEFDSAWEVLQARKQGGPARAFPHDGVRVAGGYDGFVQTQGDGRPRHYLLSADDDETLRKSNALEDLIYVNTPLGMGDYHPGIRHTPAWLSQLRERLLANPGTPRRRQHGALYDAVVGAHWAEATALVQAGADPDYVNPDGSTLLSWAAAAGNCDAVDHLLALGADPAKPDFMGDIPAELARRRSADGGAATCPELSAVR